MNSDFSAKDFFLVLLLFVIIAAGCVGVIILFFNQLAKLNSEVSAALVTASATAITSVVAIIISKKSERKSLIQEKIRENKIPIYGNLLETVFQVMFAEKTGIKALSERDLNRFFCEFTPKIIIWGSTEVIQSWNNVRSHDWQNAKSLTHLEPWNKLLIAIRKDLGNDVKNLRPNELIRLFINDLKK